MPNSADSNIPSNPDVEEVVFQPGDILFHENEQSYFFFIIQEGQVEIYKTASNGKKVPLALVHEGASIGEFAMIDRNPRSATAQAVTEVRAAKISEAAYKQLLQELPDWAVAVMKALVERLRHTNEIIRHAATLDTKTRREIETVEYDSSVSKFKLGDDPDTIVDETPMLGSDED